MLSDASPLRPLCMPSMAAYAEIASRRHIETFTGLTDQALRRAGLKKENLDAWR